jgi:hypothetical protein
MIEHFLLYGTRPSDIKEVIISQRDDFGDDSLYFTRLLRLPFKKFAIKLFRNRSHYVTILRHAPRSITEGELNPLTLLAACHECAPRAVLLVKFSASRTMIPPCSCANAWPASNNASSAWRSLDIWLQL